VDSVVGSVGSRDQEFWVYDVGITLSNIVDRDRIHVMDQQPILNLSTFYSQITTKIPRYGVSSSRLPLARVVELLIDPSVESERRPTNNPTYREITKAIFKCNKAS
jgi:hypothetical protein